MCCCGIKSMLFKNISKRIMSIYAPLDEALRYKMYIYEYVFSELI